MAGRTANIQVKLSSGAFTGELKKTEAKVKASGQRMGKSVSQGLNSGFLRGQKILTGMGQSMGRMIKQAGTIGAAFATGALIKDSLEIHQTFQNISFLLSKIPNQVMTVAEVQTLVTGAAERTTRTTKEMAGSFRQVYEATGDLAYAKESLDMIGKAATASGAPIEQIAQVAEMVRRKWGFTGDAAEQAMAQFIEKTGAGGLALEGLSGRLDLVAGEAAIAGLDVTELLGTLIQLDNILGEKAAIGLRGMLDYMKEGTTQAKALEKAGNFEFKAGTDALDKVKQILESPEATDAALTVFTSTTRTAFDELRKPFTETLEASLAAGETEEAARAKGLEAYDKMIASIRKTEMTANDIDRLYEKRVATDPSVKMREALNKVRDAFQQPKMIEAITKLADKLPALATAVADIVAFIVDNPLGSAGMGMGLRVGLPMLMSGGMGMGGAGAAGAAAGAKGAAAGMKSAGAAAQTAGGRIKGMGANAMGVAGSLAGVAALGFALGKIAERYIESEGEKLDPGEKMKQKIYDVTGKGTKAAPKTIEEKIESLKTVEGQRAAAIKERTRDTGVFETITGGYKSGLPGVAAAEGLAIKESVKLRKDVEAQIMARLESEKKAAKSAQDTADAFAKAAKALGEVNEIGKSNTSRGTGKKLSTTPGSEPTSERTSIVRR